MPAATHFTRLVTRILLLCALVPAAATADHVKVPIIPLGWQIAFEAPTLRTFSYDYPNGSVQFRANSGRFNISVFVEPPPAEAKTATHAACRDFYWAQGSRNPTIDATSVKQTTFPSCESVTYRSKGEIEGKPFVQDSVNCFFVHEGKWVDVHASIIEPTAADTKMLAEFGTHLTHGPQQPSKGIPEKLALEGLGTAAFSPPAGWLVGNTLKDATTFAKPIFTLSFQSPSDPNAFCMISLIAPPNVPGSREDLYQLVENSTKSAAGASVEGKAVIRDLKLKQGLGALASFTDASLVGKPTQQGNSKVITSGFIVPKPSVLVTVTMFADDAKGEDMKKMIEAIETFTVD